MGTDPPTWAGLISALLRGETLAGDQTAWAMEQVMLADEPLGPVELSRRLGVTSAAATQSVHRLQAAGHVVRTPHPGDRRRQVLQVTPSGAAHVFSELGPLLATVDRILRTYGAEDRAVVRRFLDDVIAAYTGFAAETER